MTSPSGQRTTDSDKEQQSPADITQAFEELARGEQTASAMEANLASLESKLDAILAALETNTKVDGNAGGGDKPTSSGVSGKSK